MDLTEALAFYREHGYYVFKKVYDRETMDKWIEKFHVLQEDSFAVNGSTWWFANTLELAPKLMLPAVNNPLIIEFCEQVMGPFVQLDNLTLAGFPTRSKEEVGDRIGSWHRDRWAHMPSGNGYERPLSMNAISYLQDLTDENGPLRILPGSHITPIELTPEQTMYAHPDEVLVYAEAGDVVLTHNGLLHSGTPNVSGKTRYFFSVYYNMTWLKHTDSHSGPNTQRLIADARRADDRRLLRLLGQDDFLQQRANSGFTRPDEERWAKWSAEDKAALKSEAASGQR